MAQTVERGKSVFCRQQSGKMPLIKQKGFDYCFDPEACGKCGGFCCRGETGGVWIGKDDVGRISEYLAVNTVDFLERFTVRRDNRLSLRERSDLEGYACVFLDSGRNTCRIYPVRPAQCQRFPFWDYFKNNREELLRECPGIRECGQKA